MTECLYHLTTEWCVSCNTYAVEQDMNGIVSQSLAIRVCASD